MRPTGANANHQNHLLRRTGRHILLLGLLMIVVQTGCASRSDARFLALQKKLQTRLTGESGTYAVALRDLQTGEQLLIEPYRGMHAASTMKTAVMVEVFRGAERGQTALDDSIPVHNRFRSLLDQSFFSLDLDSASSDPTAQRIGEKMSRRELVFHMITISSNLATNLLMEEIDPAAIHKTLQSLGAAGMQIRRGVMDLKAFDAGLNNTTDAWSLLQLMSAIADDRAASPQSCAEMREILGRQKYRDRIAAALPPGAVWAGKTGTVSGINHDSGLVKLADGRRFALVILSEGEEETKNSTQVIADLARIIFADLEPTSVKPVDERQS